VALRTGIRSGVDLGGVCYRRHLIADRGRTRQPHVKYFSRMCLPFLDTPTNVHPAILKQ
jgi:hypothetical protein